MKIFFLRKKTILVPFKFFSKISAPIFYAPQFSLFEFFITAQSAFCFFSSLPSKISHLSLLPHFINLFNLSISFNIVVTGFKTTGPRKPYLDPIVALFMFCHFLKSSGMSSRRISLKLCSFNLDEHFLSGFINSQSTKIT